MRRHNFDAGFIAAGYFGGAVMVFVFGDKANNQKACKLSVYRLFYVF
jgi:hypothetical protein